MKRMTRGALLCFALLLPVASQAGGLRNNQTEGYGGDKKLIFTYTQNFDCVEEPKSDLNFNGVHATKDPRELQVPICQAGYNPGINPPGTVGRASKTTDPLYVLIPMFSTDNDQNPNDAISCDGVVENTICGPALGQALINFFGALPEAFKANPLVHTQCPEPGAPAGTCTMHASRVDLAPVLAQLGYISNPPTANVFVPTPNHSHLLADDDLTIGQEWWQVIPVLVLDRNDWPPPDGTHGLTSVSKLKAIEKAGRAVEAPSNFFLYFGSQINDGTMAMMHHH